MSAVTEVLAAALKLSPAERAEFRAKFDEFAAAPTPLLATLHPAWKAELARRDAMPEKDDIPWEQVEREMQEAIDEVNRGRDTSGES